MAVLEEIALFIRHEAVMDHIDDYDDPLLALADVVNPSPDVLTASLSMARLMRPELANRKERARATSSGVARPERWLSL